MNDRASFYVPHNIAELLENYGNRQLYDGQRLNDAEIGEPQVQTLLSLIHKYKKGLEQEILLTGK